MHLLLRQSHDPCADWLAGWLRARGLWIESITAEELLAAERWEHTLGGRRSTFCVTLRDGRRVTSGDVAGTVNRLLAVPIEALPVAAGDSDYAQQELYALWLSCLRALPGPVLNRPCALGLSGPWLHQTEWALRAARAGMPVSRITVHGATDESQAGVDGAASVVVVGGAVFGPPRAAALAGACRRLAADVGAELLGIELEAGGGELRFAGASPLPDLRRGGDAVLDRLAEVLR